MQEWARGQKLREALEEQFHHRAKMDPAKDPDRIFESAAGGDTCDLEAIFKNNPKKERYKVRGSSACWLPDQLTSPEKAQYRVDMGWE